MQKKKKIISPEQACIKLADLCSRSEQCEDDIIKKLIRWGLSTDVRKEIIGYLKEEKYLDNKRYARSFTNDKARFSGWGPLKIQAALKSHRISSADIKAAIEGIDEEIWRAGIKRAAFSKASSLDLNGEDGREDRIKLYRFLLGRGFRSGMAVRAVNEMRRHQKEEREE